MSDDAGDALYHAFLFDAVMWRMSLHHAVLYGNYGTPATLAWDVEHVEAETLEVARG